MKHEIRTRIIILLPVMILVAMVCVMVPSSKAYAGNASISRKKISLFTQGGRKKYRLKIMVDGHSVKARWKSTKKKIATVSSSGLVRAKRTGWTTIKATYGGRVYTCKVHVKKTSGNYKNAIKDYTSFLKNRYCVYASNGATDQPDEFYCKDFDNDGMPELLVNVYDVSNIYYVLYRYEDGEMTNGQRLGICGNFVWYSSPKVLNYIKYESNRSLSVYAKHNGVTLNSLAVAVGYYDGTQAYYLSREDGKDPFDTRISAIKFHRYVDHDLLDYKSGSKIVMHVNTPYNRSRFLK